MPATQKTSQPHHKPHHKIGARVRVRDLGLPGHVRIPSYVRNKEGTVVGYYGPRLNPEGLAYGQDGLPKRDLYLLKFRQMDLWPDYPNNTDTLAIEIYEHWLEAVDRNAK